MTTFPLLENVTFREVKDLQFGGGAKAKIYSIMSMTSLSESPNDQTQKCWLAHHIKTNKKISLNVGLEHSFFSIMLYISTNLAM